MSLRNAAQIAARASALALRQAAPTSRQAARGFSSAQQQGTGSSSSSTLWWTLGAGAVGAGLLGSNHAFAGAPSQERSFIAIKPDGVHRGIIAAVINKFEQKGYKLVAIKMLQPDMALAKAHYAEHEGKPFYPKLTNFITSGPVVAMVWEGKEVIKYGRAMIGSTNPVAAAPGTIRGDYALDVGRNLIHGSDSPESSQKEIALWFKPEEIISWNQPAQNWLYE